MAPLAVRLLLVAAAIVALTAALIMSAFDDGEAVPVGTDLIVGAIYSTDRGDPANVEFASYTGYGCLHVSAPYVPSGTSCFDLGPRMQGSYVVAIPLSKQVAPLVVGVMPPGASATTVRIGQATVRAGTRGRWFLAELEPGALGPNNAIPVSVGFE